MASRPLRGAVAHVRLPVTTGTALGRSGGLSATAQRVMAADTTSMKRGVGIQHAGGSGTMT